MHHNQHKRLAKKIVPRFEPTWTGQAVDPTSAVLPPAFTTADAQPTTSSQQQQLPTSVALPATSLVQVPQISTTQAQPTTSSSQTSVAAQVPSTTESSTSIVVLTTSTESSTSTTQLATSAAPTSTSALVQTSAAAAPTTARAISSTPAASHASSIRTSSMYTDASGAVVATIVVVPAPSATTSEAPKSTGNAGTIVGAVAGGFVGLICLIAFVSWIIRQHHKRKNGNHDDFDRQSYLRNSMMIPEDPADRPVRGTQAALALARSNTGVGPRPPTMIERKNTYYNHSQPSPSFAPGQVISFEPGQLVSVPGTAAGEPAYPSPVAFAGYTPPEQHHQSELARRPSGAQLLNRAPTNGGMYDNGSYPHTPSPEHYGPESYGMHSPESYGHDGYTYPMDPGAVDHRGMVQSVTPFQAQQYAELSRHLDGDAGYEHGSFHPISPGPGPASPVRQPSEIGSPSKGSPLDEKAMPNPFDEKASQRIDSMPPALPPFESLSRTGTPIDPNPQHAHWSYDSKAQNEGNRLSVAGMLMPEPPTPPPMAVIREDYPAPAPAPAPVSAQTLAPAPTRNAAQPGQRPASVFDADDAYGGM